jgi:acetylornithine deacetylase/succinyl-diaminopimelate desuccinylase-like protein
VQTADFRNYVRDLLMEICSIDTTPNPEVSVMQQRESAVFDILQRELGRLPIPGGRSERRGICTKIQHHPAYSQLHFTKTAERPEGLTAEQVYAERTNLLYLVDGDHRRSEGSPLALNAHIDVVAPYVTPHEQNGVVYGRGACDDKGNVVAIVGALKILGEYLAEQGHTLNQDLTAMFVIEEETGGNGSLSLALDQQLKQRYDTLVVMECCGNRIYPANRGAVWFRFDLQQPEVPLLEMAAFVIDQLEKEGRAIRTESRHPLFPQRPVQTCHGIIGEFGEHPSRICGHVAFTIRVADRPNAAVEDLVQDCLDSAVQQYVGQYGDKTKVTDPATDRPKVERHYAIQRTESGFHVDVFGSTGHMGAIFENDGAITKMATMVRHLVRSKPRLEALAGSACELDLAGRTDADRLPLEGGQGFVPTHAIDEVMDRLTTAARRGVDDYLQGVPGASRGPDTLRSSFEKLHNAAYDGDPDSPAMQRAIAVASQLGLWPPQEPVVGWTVSCDARLFANEYPGLPVLTTGAGQLETAHSDAECIVLDELLQTIEFLVGFVLAETASG